MQVIKIVYSQGLFDVYTDQDPLAPLTLKEAVFVRHNLYKGREVTAGEIEKIKKESQVQEGIDLVMPKLRNRKTSFEIREVLAREGFEEGAILGVLAYLEDYGLIDDEDYARLFVRDKRKINRYGRIKIAYLLKKKGVPGHIIDKNLALIDEDMEFDLGLEVAQKRAHRYDLTQEKDRAKLVKYLYGRGFAPQVGYRVLKSLSKHD